MVYGYARCSTNEDKQDINRQIRELKSAGAEKVIFEFEHGDAKVKENLHMLLQAANVGDTIITLEVSRLTRSTKQLCEIVDLHKMQISYTQMPLHLFEHQNETAESSIHEIFLPLCLAFLLLLHLPHVSIEKYIPTSSKFLLHFVKNYCL